MVARVGLCGREDLKMCVKISLRFSSAEGRCHRVGNLELVIDLETLLHGQRAVREFIQDVDSE